MKQIECLKYDIEFLKLNDNLIDKLKKIEVNKVEDLWRCKRVYLKENQFSNNDISQIKIRLQLMGIDLNKKIY